MPPTCDLRILCTALGFTAVVMKGGDKQHDGAKRAHNFAEQIEAFCRHAIPHLGAAVNENDAGRFDAMIEKLKHDLKNEGIADMQQSRQILFGLYGRLRERYASYATDDMLADRVLELLDAEIAYGHGER